MNHNIDSILITQIHNLIVQNLLLPTTSDNITLDVMLYLQNLIHNIKIDNININVMLLVQSLIHSVSFESIAYFELCVMIADLIHSLNISDLSFWQQWAQGNTWNMLDKTIDNWNKISTSDK
jgi:hypothetical protein